MVLAHRIRSALRRIAGPLIYARGEDYYLTDSVEFWRRKDGDPVVDITGKVRGTRLYNVTLGFDVHNEEFVAFWCSCPYEDVCKHIVAMGLAFAASLEEEEAPIRHPQATKRTKTEITPEDLQIFAKHLRKSLAEAGVSSDAVLRNLPPEAIHKVNNVNAYLESTWPRLEAFARQKGYPIIFTRDALPTEQALFRADFSADLNTGTDWLYFDVACYCGNERITLEKLVAYIERGDRFWRRDDGTLVEIANHEELERLVRLLQSFHARENGRFEGNLRNVAELEYVMTSSPHYNALRAESFREFVHKVQSGTPVQTIELPEHLDRILRPYQKAGIEWLYFLRSYRFAGILADEMGLGKTLQTLAVLSMEKTAGKPSIVVCPKTLLYNWKAEANRFVPDMKVLVYDGTPSERNELARAFSENDLIITSYGMVKRDKELFLDPRMRFNHAVLDEAQFIKNHATKNAQVVKQLNADYRLVLTSTPLENSVSELWSMYDFLMPGFLGKIDHFLARFQRPIMESNDRSTLEHLRRKVQPFMLRRTKQEVLKELPPKIEQLSPCQLS
jgi:hypothetical protein